ncbi:MAG: ATP-binding cassette domain-containing protein, partial [Clostridia bacterium]|nr:ATP-binding cassette domain-containing protein [Clostridia bacterium]
MQIVINNGSVEYDGEPVLTEINFAVRDNEKIAVVGRNGCGKTTLLRALTGEVDMTQGTGESDFGFH